MALINNGPPSVNDITQEKLERYSIIQQLRRFSDAIVNVGKTVKDYDSHLKLQRLKFQRDQLKAKLPKFYIVSNE